METVLEVHDTAAEVTNSLPEDSRKISVGTQTSAQEFLDLFLREISRQTSKVGQISKNSKTAKTHSDNGNAKASMKGNLSRVPRATKKIRCQMRPDEFPHQSIESHLIQEAPSGPHLQPPVSASKSSPPKKKISESVYSCLPCIDHSNESKKDIIEGAENLQLFDPLKTAKNYLKSGHWKREKTLDNEWKMFLGKLIQCKLCREILKPSQLTSHIKEKHSDTSCESMTGPPRTYDVRVVSTKTAETNRIILNFKKKSKSPQKRRMSNEIGEISSGTPSEAEGRPESGKLVLKLNNSNKKIPKLDLNQSLSETGTDSTRDPSSNTVISNVPCHI